MNTFTILVLFINICVSQYISVNDLRQMMLSNDCCPYLANYDPCCTINISSTTYLGQTLRDYYSTSTCCGQGDSCVLNLSQCSNCTQLCTQAHTAWAKYDPIVSKLETSYADINNQSYLKINITITDDHRKLSALQFEYTTDDLDLSVRHNNYISHINNGIYVAQSSAHKYFDIVHNPSSNIVAAVVSQQYMSSEAIFYFAVTQNNISFNISNLIVTNDQLPTRQYTPLTILSSSG